MIFEKRAYQDEAVERVRAAIAKGFRRILVVAPVAAGKTVMFSRIVKGAHGKDKRVCVIAHRTELIDQAHGKLAEMEVEAGIIQGGRSKGWNLPVQVASIATLRKLKHIEPFDVIVVDEAHRTASKSYVDEIARHPDAVVIGVTATPVRLDGKPLHAHYDCLIEATTPRKLLDLGYIVPLTGISFEHPDLTGVEMKGGDFDPEQAAQRMKVLASGIIEKWLPHRDTPAIFFACNVEHSKEMVEKFRAEGARVVHIDGTTKKHVRKKIIDDLRAGSLDVVCNVNVLTEGTDIPRIGTVILGFPTASVTRMVQAIGRARRLHDGKKVARVHDHGGNLVRLGHPDMMEGWELKPKRKKRGQTAPATHQCPQCGYVDFNPIKVCPECKWTAPERTGGPAEIEEVNAREISLEEAHNLHLQRRAEYQALLRKAREQGGIVQGREYRSRRTG